MINPVSLLPSKDRPPAVGQSSKGRPPVVIKSSRYRHYIVGFSGRIPLNVLKNNDSPRVGRKKLVINRHLSENTRKTSDLRLQGGRWTEHTCPPPTKSRRAGKLRRRFASKNQDTIRSIFTVSKSSLSLGTINAGKELEQI